MTRPTVRDLRDGAILGEFLRVTDMHGTLTHVALLGWVDGDDLCLAIVTSAGWPRVLRYEGLAATARAATVPGGDWS